jgi:uncharacterized membrane protein YcaP (DUF421 family)
MKKEEVHLDDIHRILFGEAPPIFLLEIFIRTLIIFIFLLFVIRTLGKRMSGQLTIMEMAVMLTLGAIVSVGMQLPDKGILLSMGVLLCTLVFHRGLGKLGFKSSRVEKATQGTMTVMVKDGVLQLKEMAECHISRQQLFAQLRGGEVYNLGKVKRVYLEACGLFSIYATEEEKPGLPVLPPTDQKVLEVQQHTQLIACTSCGVVQEKDAGASQCKNCGAEKWTPAIL